VIARAQIRAHNGALLPDLPGAGLIVVALFDYTDPQVGTLVVCDVCMCDVTVCLCARVRRRRASSRSDWAMRSPSSRRAATGMSVVLLCLFDLCVRESAQCVVVWHARRQSERRNVCACHKITHKQVGLFPSNFFALDSARIGGGDMPTTDTDGDADDDDDGDDDIEREARELDEEASRKRAALQAEVCCACAH
jgi:hypothetical protein